MLQIQGITDYPNQKRQLVLPDGTSMIMTMYFVPQQYGWFIRSLTYGNFTLQGLRITNQPNMLRQWRELIPFGLACFSKADREPSQAQDFQTGDSNLYLLTSDEVAQYEALLDA